MQYKVGDLVVWKGDPSWSQVPLQIVEVKSESYQVQVVAEYVPSLLYYKGYIWESVLEKRLDPYKPKIKRSHFPRNI